LEEYWSKEFPITSVTRADLVAAGISKTIVEKLSDEDMINLFSLAQHASNQKTIDSLGMMMQTLEKQKAEALLLEASDEAEAREELE
jgi:hypothetical protein